jgi:hypothetical protein
MFVWLISHRPTILFSQNKPATSNQLTILFSQNKSTPAISHQPNEQTDNWQHIHNNLILPVVNPPLRSAVCLSLICGCRIQGTRTNTCCQPFLNLEWSSQLPQLRQLSHNSRTHGCRPSMVSALLKQPIPTWQANSKTYYPNKVVEIVLHMLMPFCLRYGNQNYASFS